VFESYFCNELRRELKACCDRINVPFKILLVLDNVPGHPPSITEIEGNIKDIFLSPNTTAVIQQIDEGVIETFKSCYLLRTFSQVVQATDCEDEISLEEFF
jgi:hypothetical protein